MATKTPVKKPVPYNPAKDEAGKKTELAVQKSSRELAQADAMDADMFAADAGHGMEGATSDSFAIPFLTVLQKGSPQVDETVNGGADLVEGAKAGMLYDNVSRTLYDGKTGALIVPCAYRRVFIHWGPRSGDGAGFKGELTEAEVAEMRKAGKVAEVDGKLIIPDKDGVIDAKKCGRISDTRNHYVLVVDEETGVARQAVLSLTSTQIKKSKGLMAALAALRFQGPNGLFMPPTFASTVRTTTTPEQNDQGSWYGVKFELEGRVNTSLYNEAKAFHALVLKGNVAVKYEEEAGPSTSSDGPASF